MALTPLLFVSSVLLPPSSSSSLSVTALSPPFPSSPSSFSLSRRKQSPARRQRSKLLISACAASSTASASDALEATAESQGSLSALLSPPNAERYVFFGGKGGVGKTTTSCSTAVALAEKGFRVLLISTDPAHSVGDALALKLAPGKLTSVEIDPTQGGSLDAVECDPAEAVAEFRELIKSIAPSTDEKDGFNAANTNDNNSNSNNNNSAWKSIADKVKINEFADILDTVPPGADELIALVRVLDLAGPTANGDDSGSSMKYDRIIIDTAPTGHTLRLLAFPDFLEKFLDKALALRGRLESARGVLSGIANVFMATTGAKIDRELVSRSVEEAVMRVQAYREKMLALSDLFRDPARAEFVVVTIATNMAVAESERLIEKLWDEGVWCRHVVVNQLLPAGNSNDISSNSSASLEPYLKRMRMAQATQLAFATEQLADVYNVSVSTVPLFDTEVRGVFGLKALAAVAFTPARMKNYGKLFQDAPGDSNINSAQLTTFETSQFAFVGGKGGVGKTSTSAALGVALAQSGHKTLVLSTDPAHSLSDAFDTALDGTPKKIESDSAIDLYGMEIDPAKALEEFQSLVREFSRDKEDERGLGGEVARTFGLGEFASLLDNAPPGIDELVALTQVLELIKYGDFSRVIVDTAPTGHTLRLLAFPEFLDNLLGKLVRLKARLDGALKTLRNAFKSSASIDLVDSAAERVENFRQNMALLKSLIENNQRTQFVVVTIPTNLAMAESNRLLEALKNDNIQVNNLIVNQVIPDRDAKAFIHRIAAAQENCIAKLQGNGKTENSNNKRKTQLVRVPAFDTEVRGVYALRAMGLQLFRENGNDKDAVDEKNNA